MAEDAEREVNFSKRVDVRARRTAGGRNAGARRSAGTLNKRGSVLNKRQSMVRTSLALPADNEEDDDVPEFAVTLAGIFAETQELQELERQEQIRKVAQNEGTAGSRLSERRDTGGGRTGRRLTDPMAKARPSVQKVRRNVGELRDTDFRGYESLQDLLNSTEEWKKEEPEPESPPSRPVTVPTLPNGKPVRRRPQLTATDKWDLKGRRIYPKLDVQQPVSKIRHRNTNVTLLAEDEFATSSSSSSDSSDSDSLSSAPPASNGTSEELVERVEVSADWNMLLSFARDGMGDLQGEAGLCAGDDLVKWASAKDKPSNPRREVTIVTRPQVWSEHHREEVLQSPLRPGVYVGHGDNETMLLESAKTLRKPPGLPDSALNAAQAAIGGRKGPRNYHSSWLSAKRKMVLQMSDKSSRLAKALNLIMEEEEDERRHEDSRNYQAWRKKVIECARSMRLEVDRFQLEPKLV